MASQAERNLSNLERRGEGQRGEGQGKTWAKPEMLQPKIDARNMHGNEIRFVEIYGKGSCVRKGFEERFKRLDSMNMSSAKDESVIVVLKQMGVSVINKKVGDVA